MTTTAATAPQAVEFTVPKKPLLFRVVKRNRAFLLGLLGVVVVLASWQISTSAGWVDVMFSSSPWRTFTSLIHLLGDAKFWTVMWETAWVLLVGLGISFGIGIPVGLLLGRIRVIYEMSAPIVDVLYAVPHVLFLPIIIFWFGIDSTSRIVLVVWAAIMPLVINIRVGGQNLSRDYIRVSKVFCASKATFFWRIAMPGTVPYILAAIRLAVGRGLVGAIVAEFFLGASGIGHFVQRATSQLDMDDAMAAIVVIAVWAMGMNAIVGLVEKRFTHWATE